MYSNGESCGSDADCMSAHCAAGVCCASGDCCRMPSDCPKTVVAGVQLVCNDTTTCQGSGGAISCKDFRCAAIGGDPNDSACTVNHVSKPCAPYKPVNCTGAKDQKEPACPTSCAQDADCTADAHCTAAKVCVKFVVDGAACAADGDCTSGHCAAGICCTSGTCCRDAQDCASLTTPAVCTDGAQCKGSRMEGMCSNFQCRSVEVPDSTGCAGLRAAACGDYVDVSCGVGTAPPKCATECRSSSECKPTAFCDAASPGRPGKCKPKLRDGEVCSASSQCQSKCDTRNGVCCNETDPKAYCCSANDQCMVLQSHGCVDTAVSCEGQVTTGICQSNRCTASRTRDDLMCTGIVKCPEGFNDVLCPLRCVCSLAVQDCKPGYSCNAKGECVRDSSPAAGSGSTAGTGPVGGASGGTAGAFGTTTRSVPLPGFP
jgi:hypothetical protein